MYINSCVCVRANKLKMTFIDSTYKRVHKVVQRTMCDSISFALCSWKSHLQLSDLQCCNDDDDDDDEYIIKCA